MFNGKILTYKLTIKQRSEEQEEKKEKKNNISFKASQDKSEEETLEEFCNEDGDIAMLTRNFKKFLRKQNYSRTKDFNKKYE